MILFLFFLFIIGFFILFLILASIKIIKPYQVGLIEQLGQYKKTVGSGLTIIIPFIQNLRYVDIREHVVDVPAQEVICKDNVVVTVDAVIYYQIIDPVKATYNVANFLMAITKLAQTNLRAIIGEMELDETLSGRDYINIKLREELDKITDDWGIKVTRVELQRIDPPSEIQEAMAKQMKAEREKRSMILLAEGEKQSKILTAEGEKRSKIIEAEGIMQSKIKIAEGQAEAIKKVMAALKTIDDRYLSLKYIETLPELAKQGSLIVPYEISGVISLIKSLDFTKQSKKK